MDPDLLQRAIADMATQIEELGEVSNTNSNTPYQGRSEMLLTLSMLRIYGMGCFVKVSHVPLGSVSRIFTPKRFDPGYKKKKVLKVRKN